MNMKNFIKGMFSRIGKSMGESRMRNIRRRVDESIVIHNDFNDPRGVCYIYVNGIPVQMIMDSRSAAEHMNVIKEFYFNQLTGKPVDITYTAK